MICRRMPALLRFMPAALQRHVLHFESSIEASVKAFASTLPSGAAVLDAGAGEGQYSALFAGYRYVGVDLGIGDSAWSYRDLDIVADLAQLPFATDTFE